MLRQASFFLAHQGASPPPPPRKIAQILTHTAVFFPTTKHARVRFVSSQNTSLGDRRSAIGAKSMTARRSSELNTTAVVPLPILSRQVQVSNIRTLQTDRVVLHRAHSMAVGWEIANSSS